MAAAADSVAYRSATGRFMLGWRAFHSIAPIFPSEVGTCQQREG